MTVPKALGLLGGTLLALAMVYGVWLLATPDADGGRRPVGGLIVAGAALVSAVCGVAYAVARARHS